MRKRKTRKKESSTAATTPKEIIIDPETGEVLNEDTKALTPKPKGGVRPGAGRKSREQALTNYGRAIKMLDDSVEYAIQTLINGLEDDEPAVRVKCAEILLKKAVPDKKNRGEGESPGAMVSNEEVERAIAAVDSMIADNNTKYFRGK